MDGAFLRAHGVSKRFSGHIAAEPPSFEVRRGEVFALLGPNGAGKTTTVRMLVGIIRPDEGRIEVPADGAAFDRLRADRTGYLPEDRGLYQEIPILRSLVYFGRLRGLDGREAGTRACKWLEKMGLLDRKNDRLDALSKGNQQRVQFIAAVLHRPALAILDEPFSGLDPLSQEFFLDLVRDLRNAGTTILVSSHQMDLVARILAVFPLTSSPAPPMRLVLSDPSLVEVGCSLALLLGTVWVMRRMAGRIFELGILLYGKEPTLPEMVRWATERRDR
jgi:ABC-2 type transport system ATP-binding protein